VPFALITSAAAAHARPIDPVSTNALAPANAPRSAASRAWWLATTT